MIPRLDRRLAQLVTPWLHRIDASWGARLAVGAVLVPLLAAAAAGLRTDAQGADVAARVAVAFLALVALGRGLRLQVGRAGGRVAAFAPLRDPVFDGLIGLCAQAALLLFVSFLWKRLLGLHEPIGLVVPILAAIVGCWLCAGMTGRSVRRGVPTLAEFARLGLFFAAFAWLGGEHLGALRGYSSDPEQHIAWLTQLRHFGFVPDVYAQTAAPVTYPQGFHTLLFALGGFAGMPASSVVALAPPLASTAFVYLLVRCGRALCTAPARGAAAAALEAGTVFAMAAALHSAQFSIWNVFEGTARLSAGFLHAIPVVVLLAAFAADGGVRAQARAPRWRPAALPFGLGVSAALVFALNPSHLPLHLLLCGAALVATGWRARAEPGRARSAMSALAGMAAAGAVALVLLAGDPYSRARIFGADGAADAARARVESEFGSGFDGRTCVEPACLARAVFSARVAQWSILPLRTVVEGPLRVVLSPAAPATHKRSIPLFRVPANFPDLTGFGMAPLHGWVRWAFFPIPIALLAIPALRRERAFWFGSAALLLLCCIDGGVRGAMRAAVDPGDAALRLLPDYANRASAVLFAQSLWPLWVAGVVAALQRAAQTRRTHGMRAAWLGLIVLGTLFAGSAEFDLRDRQAELRKWRVGPRAADLADLRALERAHVPRGEHYLVSSHVADSNGERWLVPIDASVPLYLQSVQPSLFLYHLSSGARVAAADFEATCAAFARDRGVPPVVREYRARWLALLASDAGRAAQALRARRLCGKPLEALFPAAELAGQRGRVALFRLW